MSGSFNGATPNWVPGYVPPAAEWNQWWSRKLDTDSQELTGAPFLSLAGGTVSGPIYLPAPMPVLPEEAVSKQYVDSLTFATGPFMPMTGGNFTGPVTTNSTITLAANPVNALDAATKGYVDAAGNVANNALTVANAAVRRAGDTMTGLLVLSGDPPGPMNAATKQYADTKLPLGGGTITGNLTVNGILQCLGTQFQNAGVLYVNAFNGYEWSLSVDGNGSKYQTYRSGWYDMWSGSTGARSWNSPGGSLMNLDGSGNLNVLATLSANTIVGNTVFSNGSINAVGSLSGAALLIGPWIFYNNTNHIQQHTAGWYDQWDVHDGTRTWFGSNILLMSLSPGGDLGVRGVLNAGSNVTAAATIAANGGLIAVNGPNNMYFGAGGNGRVMQMQPNWYLTFDTNNGDLMWVTPNGPAFVSSSVTGKFYNQRNCFSGIGPYEDRSDERTKRDIAPATCGLDEILAIQPIEFVRDERPGRREIGFSAQQLQKIIPLAVAEQMVTVKDVEPPVLAITMEPVIAALINGMKQLAAEIEQLKAAR